MKSKNEVLESLRNLKAREEVLGVMVNKAIKDNLPGKADSYKQSLSNIKGQIKALEWLLK